MPAPVPWRTPPPPSPCLSGDPARTPVASNFTDLPWRPEPGDTLALLLAERLPWRGRVTGRDPRPRSAAPAEHAESPGGEERASGGCCDQSAGTSSASPSSGRRVASPPPANGLLPGHATRPPPLLGRRSCLPKSREPRAGRRPGRPWPPLIVPVALPPVSSPADPAHRSRITLLGGEPMYPVTVPAVGWLRRASAVIAPASASRARESVGSTPPAACGREER
jgi:hypothetical protein